MRNFFTLLLCFCSSFVFSQSDTILFTPVSEFPYPAPYAAYTAHFDKLHRPFIYTANKEYGVVIFDFSDVQNPMPVRTFTVQDFGSLKPTDLIQQGAYLYVSLGGFEGLFPQKAGLAVLDISDPANASILGQWSDAAFNKGCAAVRVDGNYAYLGAMEKGVIIADISTPSAPKYVSHVELDINWPKPPGLFSVPHARGFALRGNELWTCFDAGGLRLVDIADKQAPYESSKYINTNLTDVAAPAYNTATIVGDFLFAAVDYCGIDIVDISKPQAPVNAAWENPWECNTVNWDGRPGHTNQLTTACHDSLLFASGADSEILAWSITDPTQPRLIGQHAVLLDSAVTWGIDANDSLVVFAQVWNPLNTPYIAKKGGIRLFRWTCPKTTSNTKKTEPNLALSITPNPASDRFEVRFYLQQSDEISWFLYDIHGRQVRRGRYKFLPTGEQVFNLNIADLPSGVYYFSMQANTQIENALVVKK